MAKRHFPVRPNLEQLKHQAKDLLRAYKRGDAEAVEDFREHLAMSVDGVVRDPGPQKRGTLRQAQGRHGGGRVVDGDRGLPGLQQKETGGTQDSTNVNAESVRLADAQFVLARSY